MSLACNAVTTFKEILKIGYNSLILTALNKSTKVFYIKSILKSCVAI